MTQVTNTLEGGSNNTNITTGNSGGTSGTAFDTVANGSGDAVLKYDNTHSQDTLAAKISTTTTSTAYLAWVAAFNGGGTITDHYGRVYVYMTANPPSGQSFITCVSSGSVVARINIGTDGTLRLVDKAGTVRQTFTNPITLNQWCRVEWHFVHSATVGQMEAKLFLTASSSTPDETKTDTANRDLNANINEIRFGNNLGIANLTAFWLDDLVGGATSYPGPASTPTTYTKTGAGVSKLYATGADEIHLGETGAGVAKLYAAGGKVVTYRETGAGVAKLYATGGKVVTYVERGAGVAKLYGTGAKQYIPAGPVVYQKTGAGVAKLYATGADQLLLNKTGAGVAKLYATGGKVMLYQETGPGVARLYATGSDAATLNRKNAGVAKLYASGAKLNVRARTGFGTAKLYGSGAKLNLRARTGASTARLYAAGGKACMFGETGSSLARLYAYGPDASLYVETAAGITRLYATGADLVVLSGAGNPVYGRTRVETGSGVSNVLVSGDATSSDTGWGSNWGGPWGGGQAAEAPSSSRTRVVVGGRR